MSSDPLAAYKQLLDSRRRQREADETAAAAASTLINDTVDTFDPVPDEPPSSAAVVKENSSMSSAPVTLMIPEVIPLSEGPVASILPTPNVPSSSTPRSTDMKRARSLDDDDDEEEEEEEGDDSDNDDTTVSSAARPIMNRRRSTDDPSSTRRRRVRDAKITGINAILEEVRVAPQHAPSIELDDNALTYEDAKQLAPLLSHRLTNGLRSIDLARNELHDNGVAVLCNAWLHTPYLVHISFNYNGLTDAAMKSIGSLVERCRGVTLKLMYNDIHHTGLECLTKAVHEHRIWAVALNGNELGEKGGEALANMMLPNGNGIIRLNLSGNGLEKVGGLAVAKSLIRNTMLHALSIVDNAVGDE
jgi:hypothetical protein